MYHFWICLKTSHDHSRGGCFSICTHTCGTAGLNIRIQGSGLTASVRCKISYIKGNLLISISHIASGLKIPGQFPAVGPYQTYPYRFPEDPQWSENILTG